MSALPLITIDARAQCSTRQHVWPLSFTWGDPCNCGAFYLLRDERGEIQIEPAPAPEQEED